MTSSDDVISRSLPPLPFLSPLSFSPSLLLRTYTSCVFPFSPSPLLLPLPVTSPSFSLYSRCLPLPFLSPSLLPLPVTSPSFSLYSLFPPPVSPLSQSSEAVLSVVWLTQSSDAEVSELSSALLHKVSQTSPFSQKNWSITTSKQLPHQRKNSLWFF